jgi:hypothetical protein
VPNREKTEAPNEKALASHVAASICGPRCEWTEKSPRNVRIPADTELYRIVTVIDAPTIDVVATWERLAFGSFITYYLAYKGADECWNWPLFE